MRLINWTVSVFCLVVSRSSHDTQLHSNLDVADSGIASSDNISTPHKCFTTKIAIAKFARQFNVFSKNWFIRSRAKLPYLVWHNVEEMLHQNDVLTQVCPSQSSYLSFQLSMSVTVLKWNGKFIKINQILTSQFKIAPNAVHLIFMFHLLFASNQTYINYITILLFSFRPIVFRIARCGRGQDAF